MENDWFELKAGQLTGEISEKSKLIFAEGMDGHRQISWKIGKTRAVPFHTSTEESVRFFLPL